MKVTRMIYQVGLIRGRKSTTGMVNNTQGALTEITRRKVRYLNLKERALFLLRYL
jgi:hypothetical protein